jgi:hypothetical protein
VIGRGALQAFISAVLAMAAGCSPVNDSTAVDLPVTAFRPLDGSCQTSISVIVSGDAAPTIDWAPRCGANRLVVDRVSAAPGTTTTVWAISSPTRLFKPPLTYGVVPDGATGDAAALALEHGTAYRVIVYYAGPEINDGGGEATFMPGE